MSEELIETSPQDREKSEVDSFGKQMLIKFLWSVSIAAMSTSVNAIVRYMNPELAIWAALFSIPPLLMIICLKMK